MLNLQSLQIHGTGPATVQVSWHLWPLASSPNETNLLVDLRTSPEVGFRQRHCLDSVHAPHILSKGNSHSPHDIGDRIQAQALSSDLEEVGVFIY